MSNDHHGFSFVDKDNRRFNPFKQPKVTTQVSKRSYEYSQGYQAYLDNEDRKVPDGIEFEDEWIRGWDAAEYDNTTNPTT